MDRVKIEPFSVRDSVTGTTTDAYVSALDVETQFARDKSIRLTNTDGANGLKYKLLTYMHVDGQSVEDVLECTLAAGDTATFQYQFAYARMVLQVKAAVAESQATYQVDYLAMGI